MNGTGRRQRAEQQGRRGEWVAALYLQLKGWRILARRVKTVRGEIDLIARRFGTIAFIEVKQRTNAAALNDAIDRKRLSRVAAAVHSIAHLYAGKGETLSIDVILVAPRRWPRHLVNVWHDAE